MTKRMTALAIPVCASILGFALSACTASPPDTQAQRIFDAAVAVGRVGDLDNYQAVASAMGLEFRTEEFPDQDGRNCGGKGVLENLYITRQVIWPLANHLGLRTAQHEGSLSHPDMSSPVMSYYVSLDRDCLPQPRVKKIRSARIEIAFINTRGCVPGGHVSKYLPHATFRNFVARGVTPSYVYSSSASGSSPVTTVIYLSGGEIPYSDQCVESIVIHQSGLK